MIKNRWETGIESSVTNFDSADLNDLVSDLKETLSGMLHEVDLAGIKNFNVIIKVSSEVD